VTIDVLPDIALLEIFDAYLSESWDEPWVEAWHTLVHVCRKWRTIVFGSPRRLNLRLYCTAITPVREMLDIWPPLHIVLSVFSGERWGMDNVFAALEHNDRICDLTFYGVPSPQLENGLAAMQHPFPELKTLHLQARFKTMPVVPASFLGGSAPHLQRLFLDSIPFSGLPNLLLSATRLIDLDLRGIPDSGYISPEAMSTCLSVLTRLESLVIEFESPRFLSDRESRRPPPQTRTLLPVLTKLQFKGVDEYLEYLLARIDVPLFNNLEITFFHRDIFYTPQLTLFISRAPKFNARDTAYVYFSLIDVSVTIQQQTFDGDLKLGIFCEIPDQQFSSVAQVCNSFFPQALIPAVEHLHIGWEGHSDWQAEGYFENNRWLELLQPFTAVKDLYISLDFTLHIASALQELAGERVTDVLPALQTLFLELLPSGHVQEAIGQFVASRQLSGHPVVISLWE
jgi:hypothetical protein